MGAGRSRRLRSIAGRRKAWAVLALLAAAICIGLLLLLRWDWEHFQIEAERTRRLAYAVSGVYLARVTIADKQGRAVQVFDRKVPYTR